MATSISSFRNPLQWIAVLVPSLICAAILDYGFSSILFTALVLILSSIFFIFSKQKPVLDEKKTVKDEANSSDHQLECFPQVEEVVPKPEPEKERTEGGVGQIDDYLVGPPDSFSESESIGHSSTSEDSEVDWPYSGNVGQSRDCSDDSISDEESLIEIALPSGHYVGHKEEDSKLIHLQPKLPDFSPESIFRQHNLVELLAEINEEDNLIEIDISMGSIKCSRFEIEA